jgi:phage/plasmid-associated DNA primase
MDEQRVREWWHQWPEALIGMPTGSASGLLVIDVDMKEGRDGETSLAVLGRELGQLPETIEALTPNGGRHLYFRAPKDMTIGSSAGRLGVGLDVRGEGGYVILPPSRTNGRRYEWEASSEPGQVHDQAWKYAGPETPIRTTDAANAKRLITFYGEDVRYTPERGWMVWDGRRWAADDLRRAMVMAKDTARRIYDKIIHAKSDEEKETMYRWARQSQMAKQLDAMLYLTQSEPGIAARYIQFDAAPWAFNCRNGTLDLRTGELVVHRREDPLKSLSPIEYDPGARCPLWLAFLKRIMCGNTKMIEYLRRAVGYTLTGLASEQCLFFCYGRGANGKSVFLETVMALLGEYGLATATQTLMTRQHAGIPNDVARLSGSPCSGKRDRGRAALR